MRIMLFVLLVLQHRKMQKLRAINGQISDLHHKKVLAINRYPKWAYDLARHRETKTTTPTPTTATTSSMVNPTTATTAKHKGYVSMPYFSGTTAFCAGLAYQHKYKPVALCAKT